MRMYGPAPPRPKKTSIVRAKTGCRNCRIRRKKCDEKKPACGACTRLGRHCEGYATKLEFRKVSFRSSSSQNGRTHGMAPRVNMTMRPTKESFYMCIWENQCTPALHPIFRRCACLLNTSPVITDAMMALSARQLSRMLPRERGFGSLGILGSSFGPDPEQRNNSEEFSSSAMRNVARWTRADLEGNSTTTLAVLVLFCHLESLMSNFQGFYLHSAAIETFMESQHSHATQRDSNGASLSAAWTQTKLHNWWRRFHFSTPYFQRNHPSLMILPTMLNQLAIASNSRVSVLTILCESYRLTAASFMRHYDAADIKLSALPSTLPHPSSKSSSPPEEQLDSYRAALNSWFTQLAPSEFPIDPFCTSRSGTNWDSPDLQILPLHFHSHDAAMNFAYYVVTQVVQCSKHPGVFQPYNEQMETGDASSPLESWITILLRIAVGINWENCVKLNMYTIGLSSMLLACVLRSSSLGIGLWMEDWLNQRYQEGCLEEGSFPIYQILQVLGIINQERRQGRHVYAICQPIDDGGGVGKFDSYNSQRLESVLVYGWYVNSSTLYSRYVTPVT
ncbi:hypothetical protein M426DRAFT_193768 [Hypoxylon sp. CI-4A]|nr:hypothetical protein M426DRAFT_193768 [Hypoxylon sp. CI-4A]